MKKNKGFKLYFVRTLVMARNVPEAIRKAKKEHPTDVYVSEDWKEGKNQQLTEAIGFEVAYTKEEDEEAEV